MKSKFILLLLVLLVVLTGCGTGSAAEQTNLPVQELSLEQLAEQNNAMIYEPFVPYNYETEAIGADGKNYSINAFSVMGIEKKYSFQAGDTTLNNVIVLQFGGDFESVKAFMENKAYIITIDNDGNESTDISSGVWSDGTNDYMLFYSDSTLGDFVILGGFSADKNNGYSKVIFEL